LENQTIRGYLKNLGYLIWRLPIFYFIRSWLKHTYFTIIHYHEIHPDIFREHLGYYKKHYTIISLHKIRDFYYNISKIKLPENSLIITFDDGWRSNYELLSLINEYNPPITIFLSTGLVGTNKIPSARPSLETTPRKQTKIDDVQTSRKMLNQNEILEMIDSGVDFQSHGVNHRVSTSLTLYEFRFELDESKKYIEKLTNQEVFAFAYPYNEANINQAKVVEEAGYQIARKGDRILNSMKSSKYLLNSIGIRKNCSIIDLQKSLELAKMKTALIWLIEHLH
jgi:peptidoglycan/xylan/chitin deacetylase (PgdA/CDA1 family)